MRGEARTEVLAAVRRALGPRAVLDSGSDLPPSPAASLTRSQRVERFLERVRDYRTGAMQVADDQVTAAVAELAARHRARRLVVASGFPSEWRPIELELVEDTEALVPRELENFDGALTSAALGTAETGTFVLDARPDQGRRALSLLPDLHICVIDAARVLPDIPEAIAALGRRPGGHGHPLTFVSGPSATADIELRRVHGVHGPRRLEVLVVARAGAANQAETA